MACFSLSALQKTWRISPSCSTTPRRPFSTRQDPCTAQRRRRWVLTCWTQVALMEMLVCSFQKPGGVTCGNYGQPCQSVGNQSQGSFKCILFVTDFSWQQVATTHEHTRKDFSLGRQGYTDQAVGLRRHYPLITLVINSATVQESPKSVLHVFYPHCGLFLCWRSRVKLRK